MKQEEIDAIRAQLKDVSPAPWQWQQWPCESMKQALDWFKKTVSKGKGFKLQCVGALDPDDVFICITGNGPRSGAHAQMIVTARKYLPALLDEVDRLSKELREKEELIKELERCDGATYMTEYKSRAKKAEFSLREKEQEISALEALVAGMDSELLRLREIVSDVDAESIDETLSLTPSAIFERQAKKDAVIMAAKALNADYPEIEIHSAHGERPGYLSPVGANVSSMFILILRKALKSLSRESDGGI